MTSAETPFGSSLDEQQPPVDDADHADVLEVADDEGAADAPAPSDSAGAADTDESGSDDSDSAVSGSAQSDLDEGDIAADYIEELLDILDLDGDIDIETRGGRSYISVDSSGENDLHLLSKPETVTALQELTRIAVQTQTGEFSRLILDVGGSRATREQELTTLVDRAISKIEEGATAASLPPMSSYERKLVHDIVAERGFVSESEGEGRDRHTVVSRG
jgi:spoIIIJ-associated protein